MDRRGSIRHGRQGGLQRRTDPPGPVPFDGSELIEERFQLNAHLESREVPFFDLVVGTDGPKLKPSPDQTPLGSPTANPTVLCAPPPKEQPPVAPPTTPFDPTKMRGFLSMQYAPGSATATGNAVPITMLLSLLRMETG